MRYSLVFGLVVVAIGLSWSALAQTRIAGEAVTTHSDWSGLITHFATQGRRSNGGHRHRVRRRESWTVYHIGGDSGQIQLKSVRPLRWDMEMNGYNTGKPSPNEVRGRVGSPTVN